MKSAILKYKLLFIALLMFSVEMAVAQNRRMGDNMGNHKATQALNMNGKDVFNIKGVAIGVAAVDNSAIALQVGPAAGGNKAMVIPRVADLLSAVSPSIPDVMAIDGMMVFNNSDGLFYIRQNGVWISFGTMNLASGNIYVGDASNKAVSRTMSGDASINASGVLSISANAVTTAKILDANVTTGKIADLNITTSKIADRNVTPGKIGLVDGTILIGTATGEASSQFINGDIVMDRLGAVTIGAATRGVSKVLTTNVGGTLAWSDRSEFASTTLNSGQIRIGNASNNAAAVTPSGDVTIGNTGVTTIAAASKGNNKVLTTDATGIAAWTDKSALSGINKTVATYTGNPFTAANTAVTITVPVLGLKADDGLVVNIKASDASSFDYIMILSSHAEDGNMVLRIADMRPLPDDGIYVRPGFAALNFIATSYHVQ